MTPIQVKLILLDGNIERFYFSVPASGNYDLKIALVSALCKSKIPCNLRRRYRELVHGFKHNRRLGTFKINNKFGSGNIVVKELEIQEISERPPRWRVEFQLESGLHWCGYFECAEPKDLNSEVRRELDWSPLQGYEGREKELYEAASVFRLGPVDDDLKSATCNLEYAGVTIGTVFVSKDS